MEELSTTKKGNHSENVVLIKKVAELYESGLSALEIADQLQIPRYRILRCLREAHALWRTQSVDLIEKRKMREALKLDMIENEAWEAWHLSKRMKKQITETIELERSYTTRGDRNPSIAYFEGKPMSTFHPTKSTKTESVVGDLGCLRVMIDCIAARRRLFGLDAPQRTSLENPDGTKLLDGIKVIEVGRAETDRQLEDGESSCEGTLPS